MSILSKVTDFLGGSFFGEIKDAVVSYFPPDMSPKDKAEFELKIKQLLYEKEKEANKVVADSAEQLDKRIAEQEGTAKDLKTIPVLGHAVLFARGAQRPIWGFLTMWFDAQWFFGNHNFNDQQNTALLVMNALVLSFLYGERALINVLPFVAKVFVKKP